MKNVTFEGETVKVDGNKVGEMERNEDGTWTPNVMLIDAEDGKHVIRQAMFPTRLDAEEAVVYHQALIDAGLVA